MAGYGAPALDQPGCTIVVVDDGSTDETALRARLAQQGGEPERLVILTRHGRYVDQQPVDTLPRLLRQRTRWYQGHMDSIRRLPAVWCSTRGACWPPTWAACRGG